jgi:hypothetical protein
MRSMTSPPNTSAGLRYWRLASRIHEANVATRVRKPSASATAQTAASAKSAATSAGDGLATPCSVHTVRHV